MTRTRSLRTSRRKSRRIYWQISSVRTYPAKAQEIREWNAVTRRAIIAGLDVSLKAKHADKQVELWRMRKGEREVQCVAVYTIVGLDLRLLEAGEIQRTQLCPDAPTLLGTARGWQQALGQSGWADGPALPSPRDDA